VDHIVWFHLFKGGRDNDLPASIYSNGTKKWCKNGKLHRENDMPAVTRLNGDQMWYKNGKLMRLNGEQEWYENGERHRDDDFSSDILEWRPR